MESAFYMQLANALLPPLGARAELLHKRGHIAGWRRAWCLGRQWLLSGAQRSPAFKPCPPTAFALHTPLHA